LPEFYNDDKKGKNGGYAKVNGVEWMIRKWKMKYIKFIILYNNKLDLMLFNFIFYIFSIFFIINNQFYEKKIN
jgi:hypothetical protein